MLNKTANRVERKENQSVNNIIPNIVKINTFSVFRDNRSEIPRHSQHYCIREGVGRSPFPSTCIKMANQSTDTNSPDYFKLLDDVDEAFGVGSDATNGENNVLNPNGNFLFGNYDFNGNGNGTGIVVIGSSNNGTIGGAAALPPSTTASFSSLPVLSTVTNQSLEYQFDYGTHSNDSVKQNYEAGSNFMLLLEDFGEYFYNYNGSNGGISVNGSNSNTGFDSQTNCSIANSTCADNPGEYWMWSGVLCAMCVC